jgi:hypothetical protein
MEHPMIIKFYDYLFLGFIADNFAPPKVSYGTSRAYKVNKIHVNLPKYMYEFQIYNFAYKIGYELARSDEKKYQELKICKLHRFETYFNLDKVC